MTRNHVRDSHERSNYLRQLILHRRGLIFPPCMNSLVMKELTTKSSVSHIGSTALGHRGVKICKIPLRDKILVVQG
jgi:hypothetical protein